MFFAFFASIKALPWLLWSSLWPSDGRGCAKRATKPAVGGRRAVSPAQRDPAPQGAGEAPKKKHLRLGFDFYNHLFANYENCRFIKNDTI